MLPRTWTSQAAYYRIEFYWKILENIQKKHRKLQLFEKYAFSIEIQGQKEL